MPEQNQIVKEDEIDLIELVKVIWSKRWFIVRVTGAFLVLGLVIAFTSPKEYEASCTLIPEAMDGGVSLGGSLGGLASLAGIDLGGLSGGATINPGLYRSVAQSTPFLVELMNTEFYFSELEKEVSLYDYYTEHQKISLLSNIVFIPFRVLEWIKPAENESGTLFGVDEVIISLSKYQQQCADDLVDRILVTMDWELNVVTIEVEMQDPVVAAEVGRFTQDYITNYVTQYAVSKSEEQLAFVQKQYLSKKDEFERTQLELATFRDKNQYVNTAKAKSEEERLQSKYNLAFNVYNQLAQQVETIKLQINENTPVFTVLEPVKVPVEESRPKKFFIIIGFILLGIFSTVLLIFLRFRHNLTH